MKKLLILALLILGSPVTYGVDQPNNLGYSRLEGSVGLPSYTLAQMNALTPLTTGYMIHVQDALQSRVCVSTGTGTGAWVIGTASGTFTAATYPHCN